VSTFDVLGQFGTAALIRFVGALLLFLALHLVRLPLLVAVRVVEMSMRRVDATPPAKPPRTPDPLEPAHRPGPPRREGRMPTQPPDTHRPKGTRESDHATEQAARAWVTRELPLAEFPAWVAKP
jgi:hypothetical protein